MFQAGAKAQEKFGVKAERARIVEEMENRMVEVNTDGECLNIMGNGGFLRGYNQASQDCINIVRGI